MENFTTRQMAELLITDEWRVRRLFEDGTLDEVEKFGGKRMIPKAMIPAIVSALEKRGWIGSVTNAENLASTKEGDE